VVCEPDSPGLPTASPALGGIRAAGRNEFDAESFELNGWCRNRR